MDSLPSEIIHDIILRLPANNLYDCLTVCKQWYHLALRLLYTDICIGRRQTRSFLETAQATFPKAGRYLKTLVFGSFYIQTDQDTMKVIMDNAINIESINYGYYGEFLDYLLDSNTDVAVYNRLSHIKGLYEERDDSTFTLKYLQCMFKFKENINTVHIGGSLYRHIIRRDGSEGILGYIHQFPHLNKLVLDVRSIKREQMISLSDILDNSHNVADILFYPNRGYSHYLNSIYPSMTHFTLRGGEWDQALSESIVQAFPNLERLYIRTASSAGLTADKEALMSALMGKNDLRTFVIALSGCSSSQSQMVAGYFYSLIDCDKWHHVVRLIGEVDQEIRNEVYLEIDKQRKISKIRCFGNTYQYHLNDYGMHIKHLILSRHWFRSVNLGEVNRLCPNLIKLSVRVESGKSSLDCVNPHLISLTTKFVTGQSIMNEIQVLYPNLEEWKMSTMTHHFFQNDTVSYVTLPQTPLKHMTLTKWMKDCPNLRVIIQRVIDGTPAHQWEYTKGYESIIQSSEPSISTSTIPTLVFTHSSIVSVTLEEEELSFEYNKFDK